MNEGLSSTALRPLSADVVSVQSQVVYGRVGNNVAAPTLEALGLSVVAVPTVVLSNTPHYLTMHGGALPVDWFEGYLHDLSARGALTALRAVLAGYLGDPAQAEALARWMRARRKDRAELRILIDPVMGDHDCGFYVDARLADVYRRDLLPLADGLTPNSFELAHLTGLPVSNVDSVVTAARTLLSGCTQWVVVTSAVPSTGMSDEMQVVLVSRTRAEVFTHPRIDVTPKGTGDLFCATLAGLWLNGASLSQAVGLACGHVLRTVRQTQQAGCAELLLPSAAGSRFPHDMVARERVRHFTYRTGLEGPSCKRPLPI